MARMIITSLAVTLLGVAFSLTGSFWLLFGFKPTNSRYVNDGGLYPGEQTSTVVPNLLADQRRPLGLVAIGGCMQVIGGVLGIAATLAI
jgi:hypothetical protein